jgi:chromosome segregation ATPase
MERPLRHLPEVAAFVAGVAAAALMAPRRRAVQTDQAALDALRKSVAGLEARLAARETESLGRFEKLESRLDEHASKLAEIPSTGQIIAAMEQLLSKTMSSLDSRLQDQAETIDILKTTVSQTDGLLERVLESLDSLQTPV